jgi:hypothetical protein
MTELKAGVGQPFDAAITRGNSRNGLTSGNTAISVTIVGEFVQWNEEAIARCTLLTPQVLFLIFSFVSSFLFSCFFSLILTGADDLVPDRFCRLRCWHHMCGQSFFVCLIRYRIISNYLFASQAFLLHIVKLEFE